MEQQIYKAIVNNMRFSYSRVSCFNDCRYQWFLKYIDESEDKELFYASYGKLVHSILERFYTGKLQRDELTATFLREFSAVAQPYPSDKIAASYVEKGINYFNNFEPVDGKILGVEKKVEFNIGGYDMIGFIDLLYEKDGEIYVLDNKSRELKPRSKKNNLVKDKELDDMLKQLYVYSAAVYDEYGKFPKYLCFNCFKNGVFIQEEFNEDAYNKALRWVVDTIGKIRDAEDFYPAIDYFKCRYLCGVHDECCYYNVRG